MAVAASLADRGDVAGGHLAQLDLLLAPQGEQPVQPLVGARPRVGEVVVGPDGAGQHLEQRDVADVRVGDRLEHERQRIAARVSGATSTSVSPAFTVTGGRSVGDGPISQMKSASRSMATSLVAEPTTTGNTDASATPLASVCSSSSRRDLVAAEVALEQLVVGDDDALDEVVVDLVLEVGELVGHLAVRRRAAVVEERRVGQEVGDAAERGLLADRQLERRDAGAEPVAELVERALEVGALPVELVDEHHAGHAELRRRSSRSRRSGPRRPRPR